MGSLAGLAHVAQQKQIISLKSFILSQKFSSQWRQKPCAFIRPWVNIYIISSSTQQCLQKNLHVADTWRTLRFLPDVFDMAACMQSNGNFYMELLQVVTHIREPFHQRFISSLLKSHENTFCSNFDYEWWSNQITFFHMPRQLSCRGMCKIVTWLDQYFLCKSHALLHDLDYELLNLLWNGS